MSRPATVWVTSSSRSASVDLPWSMCATMQKLRMREVSVVTAHPWYGRDAERSQPEAAEPAGTLGGRMANIKSQIKRNKQNEVRRERNKAVRSALKTSQKKVAGRDRRGRRARPPGTTLREAAAGARQGREQGRRAQAHRRSPQEPAREGRQRGRRRVSLASSSNRTLPLGVGWVHGGLARVDPRCAAYLAMALAAGAVFAGLDLVSEPRPRDEGADRDTALPQLTATPAPALERDFLTTVLG